MKKFYVKERYNPQIGTYFTYAGQMTKKEAKDITKTGYGSNTMHPFDSMEACEEWMDELRAAGERVRG